MKVDFGKNSNKKNKNIENVVGLELNQKLSSNT